MTILSRLRAWANRNRIAEFHHRQSLAYLKDCRRILDVGCGDGAFVALTGGRAVPLDSSLETLRANTRLGLRNGVVASGLALPFADGSFDGVHCSHLIEHFAPADAYRLLSEMGRVLQVGGVLVLCSPLMWSGFYDDLSHVRPYPPRAVMRYLSGAASGQRTLPAMPFAFAQVALHWRHRPLYLPVYRFNTLTQALGLLSSLLYPFHVWRPAANGYCLVTRRVG
jgi:SAM-dependent methyltransferase